MKAFVLSVVCVCVFWLRRMNRAKETSKKGRGMCENAAQSEFRKSDTNAQTYIRYSVDLL